MIKNTMPFHCQYEIGLSLVFGIGVTFNKTHQDKLASGMGHLSLGNIGSLSDFGTGRSAKVLECSHDNDMMEANAEPQLAQCGKKHFPVHFTDA